MPPQRRDKTGTAKEETSSLSSKQDRSVTIHPRVSLEEERIVKTLAKQLKQSEMTLWAESAKDGLLITLIKHGPDEMGFYGGCWTAKELSQITRRRLLNILIDFQVEQDELPAVLKDYIETLKTLLKTLAEKPQGSMTIGNMSEPSLEPPTEEDALVFSNTGNPDGVKESLGGMGFSLGLTKASPEDGSQ
jgi:hypothetical protein